MLRKSLLRYFSLMPMYSVTHFGSTRVGSLLVSNEESRNLLHRADATLGIASPKIRTGVDGYTEIIEARHWTSSMSLS